MADWGRAPERHGQGGADATEIAFTPERVLMQDFTGVPGVVDLAAMRDALAGLGGDPARVNPLVPVELVIDHSVIAEALGRPPTPSTPTSTSSTSGTSSATSCCAGPSRPSTASGWCRPGTGICHQVNLEYLARVVFATDDGRAFSDTLVGTDSHTTMVNGLGVLGWGVGGIEAEAAMLGQPLSMLVPPVVGLRLTGDQPRARRPPTWSSPSPSSSASHGVVGKFVEFYGPGLAEVPLESRATIGNMSPEYGATCAIFPIDEVTLDYLRFTGRDDDHVALVEAYAKEQGLFHLPEGAGAGLLRDGRARPVDGGAEPGRAGPAPGPGVAVRGRAGLPGRRLRTATAGGRPRPPWRTERRPPIEDGHVVIAAITSCTNTSNPQVMVAAGLLAKKAVERGPAAQAVGEDHPGPRLPGGHGLLRAGRPDRAAGRGSASTWSGFGCTTCIGNSGPLLPGVSEAVRRATCRWCRCCRGTGTSRAGSTPTCG